MSARPSPFGSASNEPISLLTHNARERVRAIYASLHHEPSSSLFDQLDPSVIWEFCGPQWLPFAGVFRGREGVALFFERLAVAVAPSRFEMNDFVVSAERVVAMGAQRGVARATGRTFVIPHVHLWELSEGRVRSFRAVCDTASLSAAMGAAESV